MRRRSVYYELSSDFSKQMIEMMELFLPIFSIGNIVFTYLFKDYSKKDISIITWVTLGIGVLHAMLPMDLLNEKLFKVKLAPPNA